MNCPRWNSTARVVGLTALVLALMITADSWAHWLKFPASGSGLHDCWLRGSRGNSDTTFAMVGEARLTAHGSVGGALPAGPAAAGFRGARAGISGGLGGGGASGV